jgi:hypothetical protein
MKRLNHQHLLITLIIFFHSYSLKAQHDTLTISQLFNYGINDTLVYSKTDQTDCGGNHFYGTWGINILSRQQLGDSITYDYSVLGDTAVHHLYLKHADSTTLVQDTFCSFDFFSTSCYCLTQYLSDLSTHDTASYAMTDCYSNIFSQFFTCTGDTSFCNWQVNQVDLNLFEHGYSVKFMERIGIYQALCGGLGFTAPCEEDPDGGGDCYLTLIYYHSGSDSIRWGDEAFLNYGVAINDISVYNADFKIYPNPSDGTFYFEQENNNASGEIQVLIYDLESRLIYQQNFLNGKSAQEINLKRAARGLYLITVRDSAGNDLWHSRLIKL